MKRFNLLLAFLFLMGMFVVHAQTSISGTVLDDNGEAVPGANVRAKGYSDVGTISDLNGAYTISVPVEATTLVFSFVGMKTQEIEIGGQTTINVTLQNEDVGIEEVMVVAYGTKTKREITGAVSSVNSDVLENQISVSPLRAIQGSAPGVNVITTGGQPGENPVIKIRGIGSVNAEAEPLIVLDGVVYSGNVNSISGDQIATINVLKDATATSLYGSRAANGVLLITTKGGKYGKRDAQITVTSRFGFSSVAVEEFELVGAEDFMKYSWEAAKNQQIYEYGETPEDAALIATNSVVTNVGYNPYSVNDPVGTDGQIVSGANLLWDTDWRKELIRDKANYNDVSVGIEGSTEKISYYFNGNFLNQNGAVIESLFKRFSARMNISAKVKDWLTVGTNSSFSSSNQNYPNQAGTSYTNGIQWVNNIANIYPLYERDENGELVLDANGDKIYDYGAGSGLVNASRPLFTNANTIAQTKLNTIERNRTNLFSSSFLKIDFNENFSFRTNVGYENYLFDRYDYDHNEFGSAANVDGRVEQRRNRTEAITFTNSLNYNNTFGEHTISVDAISEVFNYEYDFLRAQATGFLPNVKVISGSTLPEAVGGYVNQERMVSYLGRANYSFKSKYYVDISLRRDASTRFRDEKRWGTFFAVGGGWILSDEVFMEGLSGTINLLKIRASYGELGNNRGIGYFPYLASYETGWNNNDNTGVLQGGVADPDISWEKTALTNIAIDFSLLNNRLNATIEYYNKKSIDLIFDKPLPSSTGDKQITTNIGSMSNKGFELSINSVNIHTEDIYWSSTFNIATNKNELLELPQEEMIVGSKKYMVGTSVYDFFIRDYAGVDADNGDALWYYNELEVDGDGNTVIDDNGDPVKTGNRLTTNSFQDADKYYQGSSLPDFTGGVSTYFNFKGFDLNIMFNFSFGGKILDGTYQGLMNTGERPGQQLTTDIGGRWQNPGDITDIPKLTLSNNDYSGRSNRFLFDNDYIRLKALTVGYNLPKQLLERVKISECRFYFQADNIWTYQTHKGIDPEQNLAGITNNRSNMMKTVTFGVSLKF